MQTVNLQIILTPEQKADIIAGLADHIRGVAFDVAKKTIDELRDPMAGLPLVGTAGYWAKLKGKENGKTYSAATFRRWAKENGADPIRQSGATFYSREDARRWVFEG